MSGNEISRAVASIIGAFTSGLDVFQKVREKHRKSKLWGKTVDSKDETQLLYSLKQGPIDIQNEYTWGVQGFGHKFATGDVQTQAVLTRTLLKLNSGIVDIISSFLSSNKKTPFLDYKSLTNLSDASRAETLYSLSQLRWRLSQQAFIQARAPHSCSQCNSTTACKCSKQNSPRAIGQGNGRQARQNKGNHKVGIKHGGSTIARVPIKDSNQTQWAMVRKPKNRRGESNSSLGSNLSSLSSASKVSSASTALTTPGSTQNVPLATWSSAHGQVQPPLREVQQHLPFPHQGRSSPTIADADEEHFAARDQSLPLRRRQSKLTPSIYTFKSDSTKIGEIPMHRWIQPFDFDAMERTNAWAEAEGWPAQQHAQDGRRRARPGLLKRVFKRGNGKGNTEI